MADYTIYALGESNVTVDGGQLDGVTQGDGSHMVGLDITLNNANWTGVDITANDTEFRDSDGSQKLDGDQVFDGVSYSSGTKVEAEYSFTVTDGTNVYTFIAFNINNSSPAYGTVEGIAFVGGVGEFPPIGVPLTVISAAEGPNFDSSEYVTPYCFTAGTLIDTPSGARLIETLAIGDFVTTLDNGPQEIRWIGTRRVAAVGDFAPIRFAPGAIGNDTELLVSPQHRMLMSGWRAELLFGEKELLVPAVKLCNDRSIRQVEGGYVTYIHIAFDDHQIVFAQGSPSESFLVGPQALASLNPEQVTEITTLFPELLCDQAQAVMPARPIVNRKEAALLVQ